MDGELIEITNQYYYFNLIQKLIELFLAFQHILASLFVSITA